MTSMARRYSLAHPPPSEGELSGAETLHEAEVLELQALQAERSSDGGRGVLLLERALQIRSQIVNRLRNEATNTASTPPSTVSAGSPRRQDSGQHFNAQLRDLYDAAERLVVCCNACGVEQFKKDAFAEAVPLLDYAMQLTERDAYPLCEAEERRCHLRGVTLNNLGCLERRRGHFSEALGYMRASMEMTGVESPVAYMNISAILIQLRLNEEAAEMAQRSIELLAHAPEEPSLLAVAHHNLAMALEPVDVARSEAQYVMAHRIACETVGKEHPITQSIEQSRRRFGRQHAPHPPSGAGYAAVAASRSATSAHRRSIPNNASMPRSSVYESLSAATPSTSVAGSGRRHVTSVPAATDIAEIFPHPFLLSSTSSGSRRTPATLGNGHRAAATYSVGSAGRRLSGYGGVTSHSRPSQATSASARSANPSSRARPTPPESPLSASTQRNQTRKRNDAGSSMVPAPPSRPKPVSTGSRYANYATGSLPATARAAHRIGARPVTPPQRRLSEQHKKLADVRRGRLETRGRLSPLPQSSTASSAGTGKALSYQTASDVHKEASADSTAAGPRPLASMTADSTTAAPPTATTATHHTTTESHDGAEVRRSLEEEGATNIQRHFRGYVARKRTSSLRQEQAREQEAELEALRQELAARKGRHGARGAQNSADGGEKGSFSEEERQARLNAAATQLQSVLRGWLAKRRYSMMRREARESGSGAPRTVERIHEITRNVQTRRSQVSQDMERDAAESQARAEEDQAARARAAEALAAHHRFAEKAEMAAKVEAEAAAKRTRYTQDVAAMQIQNAWRARKLHRLRDNATQRAAKLRQARREYEKQVRAALTLQSFAHRLIAQRGSGDSTLTAARLRAAAEINARNRDNVVAMKIQRAYRGHAARQELDKLRTARYNQMRTAVTHSHLSVIQRVGRGYMERKYIGEALSEVEAEVARYEARLAELELRDAAETAAAASRASMHQTSVEVAQRGTPAFLSSPTLTPKKESPAAADDGGYSTVEEMDRDATVTASDTATERSNVAASTEVLSGFLRIARAKKERDHRRSTVHAYNTDRVAQEGCKTPTPIPSRSLTPVPEEEATPKGNDEILSGFARILQAKKERYRRRSTLHEYNAERAAKEACKTPTPIPSRIPTPVPAAPEMTDDVLSGFARIIRAKKERDRRRSTVHDYNAGRATKETCKTPTPALSGSPTPADAFLQRNTPVLARDLRWSSPEVHRAVTTIEAFYARFLAQRSLREMQRARDAYLEAQQEWEVYDVTAEEEAAAAAPSPRRTSNPFSNADEDENDIATQEELVDDALVAQRSPPVRVLSPSRVTEEVIRPTASAATEGEEADEASALSEPSPVHTLNGFARILKAKRERADRQSALSAYLERSKAADVSANAETSATVVTTFMRMVEARGVRDTRARLMTDYNTARVEHEQRFARATSPAPSVDEGKDGEDTVCYEAPSLLCGKWRSLIAGGAGRGGGTKARRSTFIARYQAPTEEEHDAALAIQCLYRGHQARKQAAMATVQRDLYLLGLNAEERGETIANVAEALAQPPRVSIMEPEGGNNERRNRQGRRFSPPRGSASNASRVSDASSKMVMMGEGENESFVQAMLD